MDLTIWMNFLVQSALFAVAAGLVFGGLAGYALASWGSFPAWAGASVGALVPVLGLLTLAVLAVVRHQKVQAVPGEKWWVRSRAGRVFLVSLVVLASLLFVSLFLGWFKMKVYGITSLRIGAWGTALGGVLVISLLVVAGAAVLAARRPTRTGAVVLGWFGCWWMFLAVVALALQAQTVALAKSVGALKYTVGDVASLLHLNDIPGEVQLPEGIDPHLLGLDSSVVDFSRLDLAQAIPDVSFSVGPGWWLVLGFGLGSVLWSFAMVNRADARTRVAMGRPVALLSVAEPSSLSGWGRAEQQSTGDQGNLWQQWPEK